MSTPVPSVCRRCGHPPHEGGACLYVLSDPMGGLEALDKACPCRVASRVESWWGARDAIGELDEKIDKLHATLTTRLDRQAQAQRDLARTQREILAALRSLGCATCPASGGGLIEDEDDRPSDPPGNGGG